MRYLGHTCVYALLMAAIVVASNFFVQFPLSGSLLGVQLGDLLGIAAGDPLQQLGNRHSRVHATDPRRPSRRAPSPAG